MGFLCVFVHACVLGCVAATKRFPKPESVDWNANAQSTLRHAMSLRRNENVARNIVFFLGDGMSITTATAARIYQGQLKGRSGEEEQLSFERFPYVALSKTYNVDYQVPDSAGTATAYFCGVKTNYGLVGLNEHVKRWSCDLQLGNEVESILDWSLKKGKSVGIVTTSRITHATPSALYAHAADRNWEDDGNLPASARGRCSDIALQLIRDNPDIQVLLGGGRRHFLPSDTPDPEHRNKTGSRQDSRNLIQEWLDDKQHRSLRHQYVWNSTAFSDVDTDKVDYLLGLFEHSHMQYELERSADVAGEPSLTEMAEMAIRILSRNKNGYFLLVEGGRIDHGHHSGSAKKALSETVQFAHAVERATEMTSEAETLLVVTADHSHTMTLGGYPKRGNPIFGFSEEEKASDSLPYTSLSYANGPGFNINPTTGKRNDLSNVDTSDLNFRQQSAVPIYSESHGGDDVAIYANGPMAHLFHGVVEQHYIAHAMAYASCVGQNQGHCQNGVPNEYSIYSNSPTTKFSSFICITIFLCLYILSI